jgi:hypothetical protein
LRRANTIQNSKPSVAEPNGSYRKLAPTRAQYRLPRSSPLEISKWVINPARVEPEKSSHPEMTAFEELVTNLDAAYPPPIGRHNPPPNQITSAIVIGVTVVSVGVPVPIAGTEGESPAIPSAAVLRTSAALFPAPAVTTAIGCEVAASGTSHNRAGAEVSRTRSHSAPAPAIESSGRSGTTAAAERTTSATAHGHTTAAMTAAASTHRRTATALTFS